MYVAENKLLKIVKIKNKNMKIPSTDLFQSLKRCYENDRVSSGKIAESIENELLLNNLVINDLELNPEEVSPYCHFLAGKEVSNMM